MPTKKAAAKKAVARRTSRVVSDPLPMPAPRPEPMPGPEGSGSRRVVYLAGCRNCCHVPIGVNAVLVVLVSIIFTLSAMLMAASVTVAGQNGPSGTEAVASR
jgi:hypothetical protein